MKNRNRTVFGRLFQKALIWVAERFLGSIPFVGPVFRVALFVFA
jgi:hypothetical protein